MLNQLRKFRDSFHGSETILWARTQYLLFLLYTGLQATDMSVFITDHRLLQSYILLNAMITEASRRRREEWEK